MKALFQLLAFALLAMASAAAPGGDPPHPAKPMLWKVEGKNLEKPSWLFGTIHVGTGPVGKLHPAAAEALDAADAVYTEVPMDLASQVGLVTHFLRSDGKKLSESIGPELNAGLEAELKAILPSLDTTPFESFKTWSIAVTLPLLESQLGGDKPLDMIIWNRAEAAEKTMGALEKPADQFGIFDALSEEEQVDLLGETLHYLAKARADGENPLGALIEAYLSGDEKTLTEEIEAGFEGMFRDRHAELGRKLMKRLLDDRNRNMASRIASQLEAKSNRSHFFAVGTGHYLGRSNIRQLLTDQGYTVTRISR